MKVSLSSQIAWLDSQVTHMKVTLPLAIADKRLSVAAATAKLNAAEATLATLTQLADVTKPKEAAHA